MHILTGLVAVAIALSAFCLAPSPAAAEIDTFEAFARVMGETSEARATCRHHLDNAALDTLGQPFLEQTVDADAAAEKLARALADATSRRIQMGEAAFCAEMLARYGPNGRVAKGLLKP